MKSEKPKKRWGPKVSPSGGFVLLSDYSDNIDSALRAFKRSCADIQSEARRHQEFRPTPTRSARKRRGKALARRRALMIASGKWKDRPGA